MGVLHAGKKRRSNLHAGRVGHPTLRLLRRHEWVCRRDIVASSSQRQFALPTGVQPSAGSFQHLIVSGYTSLVIIWAGGQL
jgi:hypothetical protein